MTRRRQCRCRCWEAAHSSPWRALARVAGLQIVAHPLPDHHAYDNQTALPWPADTPDVITTEKDAVKLRPDRLTAGGTPTRVWVAPLDFALDAAFDAALLALLARTGPRHGNTPA